MKYGRARQVQRGLGFGLFSTESCQNPIHSYGTKFRRFLGFTGKPFDGTPPKVIAHRSRPSRSFWCIFCWVFLKTAGCENGQNSGGNRRIITRINTHNSNRLAIALHGQASHALHGGLANASHWPRLTRKFRRNFEAWPIPAANEAARPPNQWPESVVRLWSLRHVTCEGDTWRRYVRDTHEGDAWRRHVKDTC